MLINSFLFLDLIVFELLKNRLGKYHKDIFLIHEYLGRLDSAIAVASYRKQLPTYSKPHIDFDSPTVQFHGEGLVHPLLDNPVSNDLNTSSSILLTGSNASGKTTFLKTVALNAIFAQSICTVLGTRYAASAFRIYTSMTITDNLFAGESYFISEIKSLKRVTDASFSPHSSSKCSSIHIVLTALLTSIGERIPTNLSDAEFLEIPIYKNPLDSACVKCYIE